MSGDDRAFSGDRRLKYLSSSCEIIVGYKFKIKKPLESRLSKILNAPFNIYYAAGIN